MKVLLAVITAVALACSTAAFAQKRDLSRLTCREFLESDKENVSLIAMWLQGYATDADDPRIVDFDRLKTDIEKLNEYCTKNPSRSIMTAAERALDM